MGEARRGSKIGISWLSLVVSANSCSSSAPAGTAGQGQATAKVIALRPGRTTRSFIED